MNTGNKNEWVEKVVVSGVPLKYIETYLDEIAEWTQVEGFYFGSNWEIWIVSDQDKQFCNFVIPQTKVFFKGELAMVEQLVHAFRMKFLSAGG